MRRFTFLISLAILLLLLATNCQPVSVPARAATETTPTTTSAPAQQPLEYSGKGPDSLQIGPWTGPAVLHITGEQGSQPLTVALTKGLDRAVFTFTKSPLDEYRGVAFNLDGQVAMEIQGEQAWKVTVLPPLSEYFPTLKVPGKMSEKGNAVLLLEGAHSIAIFDAEDLEAITAWAYGHDGEGDLLSFKKEGHYRGRAVLPKTAAWIIISSSVPYSVEVQAPCCEPPD